MADRPDACARCGHGLYDHMTSDDSCWKCECEGWQEEATDG